MARARASWTGETHDGVGDRAAALGRLAAELASATDEDELFRRLGTRLPELVPADRLTVALLDASGTRFALSALTGAHGLVLLADGLPLAGTPVEAALTCRPPPGPGGGAADDLRRQGLEHAGGILVALVVDGAPVGMLDVRGAAGRPYGAGERALVAQGAVLAGCCLARVRLVRRLEDELARERRRASALRTLADIGELLQGALSEDEVVGLVARALPRLVVTDRVLVARPVADGAHLSIVPAADTPGEEQRVPVEATAAGRVFRSGAVLFVDELDRSPWCDLDGLARDGFGSAAVLPLAAGGKTVAVLVAAARAPQRYPAELRATLAAFARLVGATLERAWEHARRDRIEASLQQSRRLESLGVLAGGIAHDFNNLLQGVLGNASLALADLPPGSPTRLPVRQIEAAAQHAATLTSQLLAYTGCRQLRTETTDLARLVGAMGDLVRSVAGDGTHVSIVVPAAPCTAVVDPAQVRQLVLGLVANAGEALAGGRGTVRVTVAEADETNRPRTDAVGRAVEPADGVVIVVEDDGAGMAPETIARVFEPFFTTKFAGRGLGLPWAMGVAHGHGGAIAIASEPGCGTRVTVFLPRSANPARRPADASAGAEARDRNVVLVVDDNESVVALAARILDREGYDVLTATDGTAALELFSRHGSSLAAVVLDVTMPGMSGDQLFLELVEHGLRAPVIVSSGFAEADAMQSFDTGTVAGFLQKPYRAQELVDVVRDAVGERG